MSSTGCQHQHLVLLPSSSRKLRCRHCHLTIDAGELESDFCPECYEREGVRRRDFEAAPDPSEGRVRYRCEDCGAIITIDGS
jgi:hypothetical protein